MGTARVPVRSARLPTIMFLLALAAVCWVLLVQQMGVHGGGDPGTLGFFVGMWILMMAAMMLPSVWPTVLVYRRLDAARRERGEGGVPSGAGLLLVGYLAAWTLAG